MTEISPAPRAAYPTNAPAAASCTSPTRPCRNTGGNGILIDPGNGAVAGQRIDSTFDNVRITNSVLGLGIASNGRAVINRSVFSGNTNAGIVANGVLAATEVNVTNSVSSNNGIGVQNGGGTVTIRLSNSDIAFNGTGILGATQSFTNNRIIGNTAAGTAPTPSRCDHQTRLGSAV